MIERPLRPQRHHFQVQSQAPFATEGRQAQLGDDGIGLGLPIAGRLAHMPVDIHIDVATFEALVTVDIEQHIAERRRLHEAQVFAEITEAIMEHHRHLLGRRMPADALIGLQVIGLQVVGGHIPARLVERLDGMQRRMPAVALGQALQYRQRVLQVFRPSVPLADILDAAVVETVLATRRRMQVQHHLQAELLRPGHGIVEHGNAAFDKGMASLAIAGVIGVVGAENPVSQRDAHGVDAAPGQPGKILAGDPALPVRPQALGGGGAQLGAPGGLVGRRQALEQAGHHPFLQYQPAAQIDPTQLDRGIPHCMSLPVFRHCQSIAPEQRGRLMQDKRTPISVAPGCSRQA